MPIGFDPFDQQETEAVVGRGLGPGVQHHRQFGYRLGSTSGKG
jgi:hypothetical protein